MKLGYSIIILLLVAVGIFFLAKKHPAPTQQTENMSTEEQNQTNTQNMNTSEQTAEVMDPELMMTVTKEGEGNEAKAGDVVVVNYTGTLTDGTVFDSSIGRAPFQFTLGAGQVIQGWDIGVSGMKKGEIRKLVIPAQYAYGDTGVSGVIPGGSTLVFEVEMLEINPAQ